MNFTTWMWGRRLLFPMTICMLLFHEALAQSQQFWKAADSTIVWSAQRYTTPTAFRTVELDISAMRSELAQAPMEFTEVAKSITRVISIPMPDGTFSEVSVQETQVMSPGLVAHYPKIKTYRLQGLTDPYAYGRLDVTNFGFHAMILSPLGDVFIDPVSNESDRVYISYFKKDLPKRDDFTCQMKEDLTADHFSHPQSNYQHRSSGEELRTYRLALACTGEYAEEKGGTVSGALSGMVTSMNRVDGVYEQELSVRFQLIDNDTLLIYLNGATDPYSNFDGGTMLAQNQTTIDDVIGSDNYDIGHVFSTGGGGIANLGSVCRDPFKAQGVTGLPDPVGDAFDIDYVAHEIGHQFGANHTFNCTSGQCGGVNRNAATAYEPGSGSTIMAYAGICGTTNDLQPHSDPFFHSGSFDEIMDYITFDFGGTCPVTNVTGNTPPLVEVGADYSIPISTPFRLDGSATDADGESLTYSWEEMDKGPISNWNNPTAQAPCFRSFKEDIVAYRYFPKISTIVNNYPSSVKGEVLPNYARTLNLRLTARDHHAGGGGVAYKDDEVTLTVINTTVPFKVNFPNAQMNWPIKTEEFVTWDVASTNVTPINCQNVNVLLSIDGGFTYPIILASNIPNTGSAHVMMPDDVSLVGITTARIMIQSIGNVFFDISNANFTITDNVGISGVADISSQVNVYPNPAKDNLQVEVIGLSNESLMLRIRDALGRILFETNEAHVTGKKNFSVNMNNIASGIYFIEVNTGGGQSIKKVVKE